MEFEPLELAEFVKETSEIMLSMDAMIKSYHGKNIEQMKKKLGDGTSLTTYVDKIMNDYVVEILHNAFPNYGILAEEKEEGLHLGKKHYEGDGIRLLVVDPLDGTRDFINGTGEFVVSVGLINRKTKRPEACVVLKPFGYDHERKLPRIEVASAQKDRGAKLCAIYQTNVEGKPKIERIYMDLGVSDKRELNKCILLKSRYHSNPTLEKILQQLPVAEIREVGSAGNKLLTLAKGEADLYLHLGPGRMLYEWDVAAELLVTERSGIVTTGNGGLILYDQPDPTLPEGIFASNGHVNEEALEIIRINSVR